MKGFAMAFESLTTRINMMFEQMENQPEDKHQLLEQIHRELETMRAEGLPLPEDLVALETRLNEEFEKAGQQKP